MKRDWGGDSDPVCFDRATQKREKLPLQSCSCCGKWKAGSLSAVAWFETLQELQMLSLFIEGPPLWMSFSLLISIVRNVISVSKVTNLKDHSFRVFSQCQCHHCLSLNDKVTYGAVWGQPKKLQASYLWRLSPFKSDRAVTHHIVTRESQLKIRLFHTLEQ